MPEGTLRTILKQAFVRLELLENERRVFLISPVAKGSTYSCGWRIQPVPSKSKNTR
jgi:hypothetical protein